MAMGRGRTASNAMKARLAHLLLVPLAIGAISFGFINTASAAYGTGAYGACTYQTQECPGGATTTGAPDTGQEAVSLLWPAIAGFIGFMLVSFVVIRYLNRDRGSQA